MGKSSLLQAMLDGTMASLDVDFWIGGWLFKRLCLLADGIYLETAWFVKTISIPTGHGQKRFSARQEAMHKNIECALVCFSKFQILSQTFEKWNEKHVNETAMACILMHT